MSILHIDDSDSVAFQCSLGKIQEGLGQVYGDVASHFFGKEAWTKKTYDERHDELLSYIRAELNDLAYNSDGELVDSRKKINEIKAIVRDPLFTPKQSERKEHRHYIGLFPTKDEEWCPMGVVLDGMRYVIIEDLGSLPDGIIGDFIEPFTDDGEVLGGVYRLNVTSEEARIINQEIANENQSHQSR